MKREALKSLQAPLKERYQHAAAGTCHLRRNNTGCRRNISRTRDLGGSNRGDWNNGFSRNAGNRSNSSSRVHSHRYDLSPHNEHRSITHRKAASADGTILRRLSNSGQRRNYPISAGLTRKSVTSDLRTLIHADMVHQKHTRERSLSAGWPDEAAADRQIHDQMKWLIKGSRQFCAGRIPFFLILKKRLSTYLRITAAWEAL